MRSHPPGRIVTAVSSGRRRYPFIIFSPFTQSSPSSPKGKSLPSSLTIFTSTPKIGKPIVPGLDLPRGLRETTGLASVKPYPSKRGIRNFFSNLVRTSTGKAAAPEMHNLTGLKKRIKEGNRSKAEKTGGTATKIVTLCLYIACRTLVKGWTDSTITVVKPVSKGKRTHTVQAKE